MCACPSWKFIYFPYTSLLISIELRCEMKDVEARYGDDIGYNIGGKVVTINQIMTLLAS